MSCSTHHNYSQYTFTSLFPGETPATEAVESEVEDAGVATDCSVARGATKVGLDAAGGAGKIGASATEDNALTPELDTAVEA